MIQYSGGHADLQLSYFCGSSAECADANSGPALQLAKVFQPIIRKHSLIPFSGWLPSE